MSTFDACFVTALLSGASMYLLAWRIHRKPIVSREELRQYMDQMLARDEQEVYQRKLHAQMVRAGRISVPRADAGEPARISSIHVQRHSNTTGYGQEK